MIKVSELQFSYTKQQPFIRDMSFEVGRGEIFGFLGPSGAGKSTLQKILTGILRDYRGSVKVLNTEVKNRSNRFYEELGVDFEFPNLYAKFSGLQNLQYFASLYQRDSHNPQELLQRVGLSEHADKKVAGYSKGMKMRLAFIRAIMHKPSILFLDEPTSGLDPAHARNIKDMILEQKQEGRTIIFTTHNMHDAQELCDRVAFIVDGQIRALDTPQALRTRKSGVEVNYTYREDGQEKAAGTLLSSLHQDPEFRRRLDAGVLTGIHSKEPTLEDVFIELTGRCLQ
ncbi:ABC transporter ATP-binding protein [Dethiobacter alkaliphilus]|uniref:ABC transporter related protein n=1 Tax=Dethiobacter alkaliphilus AHT 1 TaxID=555088 RepID=C0GK68_DETAL|nr:ABC transporter ATP-binding protein [Dethiobacter alkaliphilus]EEG76251.1 ABC transporter related protein [Dethiobacter alkaliphilus AHT 1]